MISLSLNLPYSSTTLPARLVDLVNDYWYQVHDFQMNGAKLKRIENKWTFCKLALAQSIFMKQARKYHFINRKKLTRIKGNRRTTI